MFRKFLRLTSLNLMTLSEPFHQSEWLKYSMASNWFWIRESRIELIEQHKFQQCGGTQALTCWCAPEPFT